MKRNHHLICLPQHAQKIIDGTKTTTIRAPRKRPISVGDTITFARWTANPYRSNQERVKQVTVTSVRKIVVNRKMLGVIIDDQMQSGDFVEKMAVADGFCGTPELIDYLTSDKRPEFTGFIYGWECQ